MDQTIFEGLPYNGRKELIKLRQAVSEFERGTDLIRLEDGTDYIHKLVDVSGKYSYVIKLNNFDKKSDCNIYYVLYNPSSQKSITGTSYTFNFDQLVDNLRMWIGLVTDMHEVTREYYEPFSKFYDSQFQAYFSNDDEDAAIQPFDLKRQELIFVFLSYAEKKIASSEEISHEDKQLLLEDVSKLKDEIPKVSKKQYVAALSKFAQKIKKISNKVFHDVFDVLKKEIIKKVLTESWQALPGYIDDIQSWAQHFL